MQFEEVALDSRVDDTDCAMSKAVPSGSVQGIKKHLREQRDQLHQLSLQQLQQQQQEQRQHQQVPHLVMMRRSVKPIRRLKYRFRWPSLLLGQEKSLPICKISAASMIQQSVL